MAVIFSRTLRSLETDGPWRWTVGLVITALLLGGWFAWFVFGRVSVYEVTDRAVLEVEAAAHPVAARVDGRVVKTALALGRAVTAGAVLIELDAEAKRLALDEARARLAGRRAQIAALGPEIQAEQYGLEAYRRSSAAALDESRARIAEVEARANFAERQADARRALRDRRLVSEEDFQKAQAEVDSKRATVKAVTLVSARIEQRATVETRERQARIARLERKLAELEGETATGEATIRRIEHDAELHLLRAPIDGRLGQVEKLRVGSVVRTAAVLATIVPPGKPRAVAFFPVASVGRIRSGQPAQIRLDGFAWTQYGALSATVASVGNDPVDGHVRVELTLKGESAPLIPLEHGLSGTAEVEAERAAPADLVLRAVGRWLTTRRSGPMVTGAGQAASSP
ncbi:MAG: HlyD family secretion protein [Gammaproteobacteria bacterium]